MTNQIAEALATLRRTDVHRPSAIIPADYEFVAFSHVKFEDLSGSAAFVRIERERLAKHMEATGGHYSQHAHGGNCHVCGAHCIYTAVFHHKPTNTYIKTGLDCTDKLDDSIDGSEFRSRVSKGLEAVAGKRKAEATLTEAGLAAAWAIYADDKWNPDEPNGSAAYKVWQDTRTIRDMVGKLVKYGSLSDKQINFLRILTDRVANAAERQARFAAQSAAAAPLPATEERTLVEGEVVSVKAADARFPAMGRKMVVRHPTGWKVYGRVPASIDEDGLVGKRVRFVAAIKASDRDPKFGFFSRPTKAEVVA